MISTHLPGKDRAQGGRRKRDLGLSHGDVEKEMEVETGVLEGVSHLLFASGWEGPGGSLCHSPLVI